MGCTSVRQSIVRTSLLPTEDKATQTKNYITGGGSAGAELNLANASRLSQLNISSIVSILESIKKLIEVLLSDHQLSEEVFYKLSTEDLKS